MCECANVLICECVDVLMKPHYYQDINILIPFNLRFGFWIYDEVWIVTKFSQF